MAGGQGRPEEHIMKERVLARLAAMRTSRQRRALTGREEWMPIESHVATRSEVRRYNY
jgi:hypothetical protein